MHAAIISAYKDFPTLDRLTDALARDGFRLFVHLDRKAPFTREEVGRLTGKGCVLGRRRTVRWGSYNHIVAIVALMRRAVAEPAIDYVHVISGQDYPIGRAADLRTACDGRVFMVAEPLEETHWAVQERFRRYKWLQPLEPLRSIPRPVDNLMHAVQRRIGLHRTRTRAYDRIYKGLVWVSLPADVARHVACDARPRSFLRALRWSYLPEEMFFQTVILNSPYADRAAGEDRRYMDWRLKHGTRPAILDLADEDAIARSDAFFARKIDSTVSAPLLAAIRRRRGEPDQPTR